MPNAFASINADATLLDVTIVLSHPRNKIEPIDHLLGLVHTEEGSYSRLRCLVYDRSELLLHDVAACVQGDVIDELALAGYRKTGARLLQLLRTPGTSKGRGQIPGYVNLRILEWLSPAAVVFTTGADELVYDLIELNRMTEQLEQLTLHEISGHTYLRFIRC